MIRICGECAKHWHAVGAQLDLEDREVSTDDQGQTFGEACQNCNESMDSFWGMNPLKIYVSPALFPERDDDEDEEEASHG
jgi:hypothetical protein